MDPYTRHPQLCCILYYRGILQYIVEQQLPLLLTKSRYVYEVSILQVRRQTAGKPHLSVKKRLYPSHQEVEGTHLQLHAVEVKNVSLITTQSSLASFTCSAVAGEYGRQSSIVVEHKCTTEPNICLHSIRA